MVREEYFARDVTPMLIPYLPCSHAHRRATAGFALASLLATSGCHDATAPLPADAVRFQPPRVYSEWWTVVEACSGQAGDLAAWSWYQVPTHALRAEGYGNAEAFTDVTDRRIVIEAGLEGNGVVIRHEMLHALLGPPYATGNSAHDHPPAYFQGRCVGVVYCDQGCSAAGPPPPSPPNDAPVLPLTTLQVGIDVVPNMVSRTSTDHAFTIVLHATNPSGESGWLELDPTPGVSAPAGHWLGFRIVPATQPLPITDLTSVDSTGFVSVWPDGQVPFTAGQTRWDVFDMSGAEYQPGEYQIVGIFNTHQIAVPLTITP